MTEGSSDVQRMLLPGPLGAHAQELGLELTPGQCSTLVAYAGLLRRWNRVHNLTAIDSDADVLTHHLLDCLAVIRPLERALARHAGGCLPGRPVRFLDAGSGAGLPGIPLAVALPQWRGTLVDAVQKKCAFLQQAQLELGLENLAIRHARLESMGSAAHERAHDLVVSRAFSSLRAFVECTRPLLQPQGLWAAMKGRNPVDEIAQLPAGVEWVETITLRVPLLDEQRHLVVLRPAQDAPREAPTDPRPQSPGYARRH